MYIIESSKIVKQAGFTLIELIVSLVLLGIIATFTGIFLSTAIEGYIFSELNSQRSLKAQNALDRISLELQNMDDLNSAVGSTSVSYTRNGTSYTISYDGGSDTIFLTEGGTAHLLLNEVQAYSMNTTIADLNSDGSDDVQFITVNIDIIDYPSQFQERIYPRSLVQEP